MAESTEVITQEKIVWAVISHLTGGLQGNSHYPFSEELIADEIDNLRLELIKNPKVLQTLDFRLLSQSITCLEIQKVADQECYDLGLEGFYWRTVNKIPKILSIPGRELVDYIGAANWRQKYDIVDASHVETLKYDKYKLPVAFWQNDYFYFMYLPENANTLSLRAPFERPAQVVAQYFCCKDKSYPIPGELVQGIIRNLVDNYSKYGYFRNPQTNNQANLVQGGTK